MSELRQNILTGNWVVIAPERGQRPEGLQVSAQKNLDDNPVYDAACPFCPGNQMEKDHAIVEEISNTAGEWSVRVVENKYKIFDQHEACSGTMQPFNHYGPYVYYHGCGEHYLVIEHRAHNLVMGAMNDESLRDVFACYLESSRKLRSHIGNMIVLLFKNQGVKAGASQPHPHSQIVGSRVVPSWIRNALHVQEGYFDTKGSCALCDIIHFECREKIRVIKETELVVALSPYAAGNPYEVWVVPKRHFSCYVDIDRDTLSELSAMVGCILRAYVNYLGNPDFNYFIHSSPFPLTGVPYYHLYVQIIPRIQEIGGFEIGTRIPVNSVLPEDAMRLYANIVDGTKGVNP